MKVLSIDDDPRVTDAVTEALSAEGFEVRAGHTAARCLALARSWRPDIILLDVVMPGGPSGMDALRALRAESQVPVILVTGRDGDADKVLGLEYADDYIVKPWKNSELLARIRAVLRRSGAAAAAPATQAILAGDLRIDPETREVTFAGRPLALTPTEFEILLALASHPGRVWTRSQLTERVWGPDTYIDSHALDVHIGALRRKLEPEPSRPAHIVTVWGVGFRYAP